MHGAPVTTEQREESMHEVDQRDRELLNALQGEIPISSTPYAIVGQQIDMSEKEVLKRAEKLKRAGILRRLAVTFNTRALGYKTSLVAASVNEDRVERAASTINLHPGVFQNYRRNHDYAIWFSIAVPPDSRLGLEATIKILAREAECERTRIFPTLRLFSREGDASDDAGESQDVHLDAEEVEFVRLLQMELPLQPRPFDALARRASLPEDRFFDAVRKFHEQGKIRRITASIQQKRSQFQTNAMAVWAVPADQAEEFARRVIANSAALRCYLRPTYEDWPYNVFATIQTRSVDECEAMVHDLATEAGVTDAKTLYPTREYKNTRLSLFSGESVEWEASRLTGASDASIGQAAS